MGTIRKLYEETSGATMVEYGLMLTLIAIACFTAITSLGSSVALPYNTVLTQGFGS
jgi:pilus assembly protein Flp/PilA